MTKPVRADAGDPRAVEGIVNDGQERISKSVGRGVDPDDAGESRAVTLNRTRHDLSVLAEGCQVRIQAANEMGNVQMKPATWEKSPLTLRTLRPRS